VGGELSSRLALATGVDARVLHAGDLVQVVPPTPSVDGNGAKLLATSEATEDWEHGQETVSNHSVRVTSGSSRTVLRTQIVAKRRCTHDATNVRDERWETVVHDGTALVLRVSVELHAGAGSTDREADGALESIHKVARVTTAVLIV